MRTSGRRATTGERRGAAGSAAGSGAAGGGAGRTARRTTRARSAASAAAVEAAAAAGAGREELEFADAAARRADVAAWLAAAAAPPPSAAAAARLAPTAPALACLMGGRAAAAAAAMVASGDARLATLAAQAGAGARLAALCNAQLELYGDSHIAPGRATALRALAGEAGAPGRAAGPTGMAGAAGWARALRASLTLSGAPREALACALERYEADVAAGAAPPPRPPYVQPGPDHVSLSEGRLAPPPPPTDAAYLLLRASARSAAAAGAAAPLPCMHPSLFQPAGYSPDPTCAGLGWRLAAALRALMAERGMGGEAEDDLLARCALDAAAELASTPCLVPWAVFACLSAPPAARGAAAAREMLLARWPEVEATPGAARFLRRALGVPGEWLDEAAALWEAHLGHQGVAGAADPAGAWHRGRYEMPLRALAAREAAGAWAAGGACQLELCGGCDVTAQLDAAAC